MHMKYITILNLSFKHFREVFTVGERTTGKTDKLSQKIKNKKNKLSKKKEKGEKNQYSPQ